MEFWEWVSSTGGIAGITLTPESTKTRKSIYIGNDFMSFYEGGRQRVDTFVIKNKKSIYNHKEVPMLVFENYHKSFEVKGNILELRDEVYDGFVHIYTLDKIKVTRLDTNKDITDRLIGEWKLHQKWGSYPIYSDFFVSKDVGKSLTVNLKGYIKGKKVVDTNSLVGADPCHVIRKESYTGLFFQTIYSDFWQ